MSRIGRKKHTEIKVELIEEIGHLYFWVLQKDVFKRLDMTVAPVSVDSKEKLEKFSGQGKEIAERLFSQLCSMEGFREVTFTSPREFSIEGSAGFSFKQAKENAIGVLMEAFGKNISYKSSLEKFVLSNV